MTTAPLALADATGEIDWAALELPQASGRTTPLKGFLTASATDAFLALRGTSVFIETSSGTVRRRRRASLPGV